MPFSGNERTQRGIKGFTLSHGMKGQTGLNAKHPYPVYMPPSGQQRSQTGLKVSFDLTGQRDFFWE